MLFRAFPWLKYFPTLNYNFESVIRITSEILQKDTPNNSNGSVNINILNNYGMLWNYLKFLTLASLLLNT